MNELTDICNRLINPKYKNTIEILELLLQNYLLLLDTNEFVDNIVQRYVLANNNFLSNLFHSFNPNMMIEMEYTIRSKMYYRLLDQISSSIRIIKFLKNELLSMKNMEQIVSHFCRIILLLILRILNYIQNQNISLSILELKKYENNLFILLIILLEKYFSQNQSSENDILIKPILDFFSNNK